MGLKAVATLVPGGGAPVGGSGTPGTIPVWSGSGTTLGDSPLTVSGFNVTGAGAIRATGTTAGAPAFTGSDTDTGMYFPAANQVRFSTAGALAIAVDASQNVGIGTASPGARLDVSGAARANYGIFQGSLSAFAASTGALYTYWTGSVGTILSTSDNVNTAAPMELRVGGTLGMRIDTSGNVGIGTASPASRLDVAGTITCDDAGTGLKLPATPGNADTQTLDAYSEGSLTSGFTLSGITTSAGNVNYTARWTRIGRTIVFALRFYPDAGASLTFASGWNVTLTGVPQFPSPVSCATTTDDGTLGRASVHINQSATPIAYGGGTGAYALGANISLYINGTAN